MPEEDESGTPTDAGYDPRGEFYQATVNVTVRATSKMDASSKIFLLSRTSMSPVRDFHIVDVQVVDEA